MSTQWKIEAVTEPFYIYCIGSPEASQTPIQFKLILAKLPDVHGEQVPMLDTTKRGAPKIYLSSDWDNMDTALSTSDEAAKWAVSATCESSYLQPAWLDAQKKWLIELKPEDAAEDFVLTVTFTQVRSSAKKGTGKLFIQMLNVPGVSPITYTAHLQKIYPLQKDFWEADSTCIYKGESVSISWNIKNAKQCWLNGYAVNTEKTITATLQEAATFYLSAQDFVNEIVSYEPIQVEVTNWKKLGETSDFPAEDRTGRQQSNQMFQYQGSFLLFSSGYLYQSKDQGKTWEKYSEELPTVEGEPAWGDRSPLLCSDKFYLMHPKCSYEYYFSEKKWQKIDFFSAANNCHHTAAVLEDTPYFFVESTKNRILQYVYDKKDSKWNSSLFHVNPDTAPVEKLCGVSAAVFQRTLYLAVRDAESQVVTVFRSDGGAKWSEYFWTNIPIKGWFTLIPCGLGLLLVFQAGILDTTEKHTALKPLLPVCSTDIPPTLGNASRRLYLINSNQVNYDIFEYKS